MNNTRTDRKPEIQASRILVQAKAPARDGGVIIVTAHEMSNEEFYFFVYKAPSTRTQRKNWKLLNWGIVHDARRYDPKGLDKSVSLERFLERQAWNVKKNENGKPVKWTIRYPHKKKVFTDHLNRIANPSFEPRQPEPGATFILAEWKATGRRPSKHRLAQLTVPKPIYTK